MARYGHDVVALLRRRLASTLDMQPGVRIGFADLAQAEPLPAGPFDAILHCAAAIPSAVPDDSELTRVNVEGSRRVFEHALHAGARTILFCSSMAVYGRIEDALVDPDTPVRDPNAYGRSKLACERLLTELRCTHADLRAVSIRLPGVVGPGSHHNFLSDTMARLIAGDTLVVRNPSALFNNVVHVDDLGQFADILLKSLPIGHRVITIGAEHPLSIREVVGILEGAAGRSGAVRYEHDRRSFLISSEAASSLGYRPATVRDSVRRFAQDFAADLAPTRAGGGGARVKVVTGATRRN
jgi:nucleoside-diphosphate-sugar epimerase